LDDALNERLFDILLETAVCSDYEKELARLPEQAEAPHAFSRRHEQRIGEIYRKYLRNVRSRRLKRNAKRAAVAVLIVISLIFAGFLSVGAVRSAVFRVITEWYEEFTSIFFKSEKGDSKAPNINLEVEGMRQPTFIPNGFILENFIRTPGMISIDYNDESGKILSYTQVILDEDNSIAVDNEHNIISEIEFNGYPAILMEPMDDVGLYSLIWRDELFTYMLVGQVDYETLIEVALSIEIVD